MERNLLFEFLKILYPSKVGNEPNAHRYLKSLEMGEINDLWTLLRVNDDRLIGIHGIGPKFILTLKAYKADKGI